MASKGKKAKSPPTSDDIRKLAGKKGVSIYLDMDCTSDEAKIGTPYSYSSKTKKLLIVTSLLEKIDKPLLLEIIKKVFNSGGVILKATKLDELNSYREYYKNNNDKNVLEFFSKIISSDDYDALKMSLYMRDQQTKGKSVHLYKNDIRERFGERGSNIANLCTAGYFESEFIPLYNEVTKEEFYQYYELAVGKKARALFIHAGMNLDDIQKEFDSMLAKAIAYHMEDFRVHGLGKANVNHIKKFFKNLQPDESYFVQKIDERKTPVLVIEYLIVISSSINNL